MRSRAIHTHYDKIARRFSARPLRAIFKMRNGAPNERVTRWYHLLPAGAVPLAARLQQLAQVKR